MFVIDYYDESNIKKKRRGELLDQCNKYFHKVGLTKATMSDIAAYLQIERRTLYAYYNNITDLIVDTHLYRAELDYKIFDEMSLELRKNLEGKNTREKLGTFFKFMLNGIVGHSREYPEYLDFEAYFKHLDPEGGTRERFGKITKQLLRPKSHLIEILQEGLQNDEIKELGIEAEQLAVIMNQAFRAYVNKTLVRADQTGRYNLDNLDKFITILMEGICK